MTAEERPWARRAPPDASAGYNIFTGQHTSSEGHEGTFGGSSQASNMQGVVHGDRNGDRMWPNRFSSTDFNTYNNIRNSVSTDGYTSFGASINQDGLGVSNRLASTDFNVYNSIRNSMGGDGYTPFGAPMNQDGLNVSLDGVSGIRQIPRKPPLDPLLIPRYQPSPVSSQANSLIFEGGVPLSARRVSPLKTSSNNSFTPTAAATGSFTPTASGSPSLVARRCPSAPVPLQPRNGGLQPRVPNSPNTSPWHGRSSSDSIPMTTRTPSPSDQHVNSSFGYYAMGTPSLQASTWPTGFPPGASHDNSASRFASYGFNSFGVDSGQLQSIHAAPNHQNVFPIEFLETMRDMSTMNRSRSVPASPALHWSLGQGFNTLEHSAPPLGGFGPFGTSYTRSYVPDVGSFGTIPTGISGIGLLEDAIREQQFERIVALLEQGFNPNGERDSSKTPPLLIAVSTGNERLVKLLLDAGANIDGCDSRQYTALHYAVASGYREIVNILLASGANIYAKTNNDLLPIQLATNPTIYEYLSARMKVDMEGRMSPRQAKFSSQGSFNITNFQRPSGINIATSKGIGYQEHDLLGAIQSFEESTNIQFGIGETPRQSSIGQIVGPVVGPRLMDWEAFQNLPYESTHQVLVHSTSPNESVFDEWNNCEYNQDIDVLMQDGIGYFKGPSFTRSLFKQELQEKLTLEKTSSATIGSLNNINAFQPQSNNHIERNNSSPIGSINNMNAFQPNVSLEDNNLIQQRNCFINTTMLPKAPYNESDFEKEPFEKEPSNAVKNELQTKDHLLQLMSIEIQKESIINFENTKIESFDTNHLQEAKTSKTTDEDEVEIDNINSHGHSNDNQKKFSRACDSMAPSMVEKFKATTTSSRSLEIHEIEETFIGKALGTPQAPPQAPETPRQVGESQDNFQGASSSSQKGKAEFVDVPPISALKGDGKRVKEKKKTVTFAIADSPSKEDLALIREDWHEAAQSGCIGCGKRGCNGSCLAPEKLPSTSTSNIAPFCNSKTPLGELPIALKPPRKGSVRWTRGELLGEGAYGKVFAGLNQDTGELMAVKQLKLDIATEGQERQFYLAALEREIAFYKTMRHKHIVGYIDMEQDHETGSLYIFLEYVSGGSIQSMLERFGRFSEPLVRVYTRQLLLGLEYLHGKKIVHRDIKGGNVLVDADGIVKLADFGASKAFHDPTQTDGFKSIRGSVFWMAPEVIKGDGYGRRADIWSVGCIVVEMLTAVHPWPGMDNTWTAIFHIAKASSGPPIPEGVSEVVEDFLSLCFQLDPKKRPTSTELLQHPFVAEPSTETQ